MSTKSKQNNPEQKTKNAHLTEFSNDHNPIKQAKQNNINQSQAQNSKQ
jgi:hypothetical protein